jgi:uncharacterized membrane protein YedE/YeeE
MLEIIKQPWPWFIAGPLIGLTVPLLFILGNRSFGVSSALSHICAACVPFKISFFNYDWKKEQWNLFFVSGILIGAFIASSFHDFGSISIQTISELSEEGVKEYKGLVPSDIFNWASLLTLRGFLLMIVGGFFVGFGTRYAGGCTSGHSITGLSTLQPGSLIATICFMIGGFAMTHLILPYILSL